MPIELTMPRLSDTMERGTIIKWNVKEGDKVSSGDVVADIETDKATMEMQVYDEGRVSRIVVPEGQSVEVGKVIAVIAIEEDSAGGSGKPDGAKPAEVVEPRREPRAGAAGARSAPAPRAAETPKQRPEPVTAESAGKPAAVVPEHEEEHAEDGARRRVSPVARRLADEHGIDVRGIHGSGPGGRVIKRDIESAIRTGQETAAAIAPSASGARVPATPVTMLSEPESDLALSGSYPTGIQAAIIPLSNVRQTIARRLVESKTTIPHYQVTSRLNMDPMLALRTTLNQQLEAQGVKLSLNDLLIRACALAIHHHPEFNASWAETAIEIHGHVNIGIAISLPPERGGGLVVAVIRDADRKALRQISAESSQLAEKARTRGLTIQEMSDSTFTISNLGMYGVEHFTAIINPPNSAILAVGAALEQPVVRDGQLAVGHEMTVTLSLDHRVIDGAMAAQFLLTLKQLVENPATLLV